MLKRLLIITMTCCFLTIAWAADKESDKNSLSRSVHQAQSQGKVLSAKTRNNEHLVKVLTPEGHVKTIKQRADQNPARQPRNDRQLQYQNRQTTQPNRNKTTNDSTNKR